MHIIIETERLFLRTWSNDDLPLFVSINCDAHVMEFFPHPLSSSETIEFYKRIQKEFLEYGYGLYAVEIKTNHQFIGYTGFHHILLPSNLTGNIEIGWRLAAAYWNQGLATEAAKACIAYAREHLPFSTIYSFTSSINSRSERVMQKIGMHKLAEFINPTLPPHSLLSKHVLYRINL